MVDDVVGPIRDLYAGRYAYLVAQLAGVTGDLSVAEDVVQEAFMKALADPRAFSRLSNPEAWLRTVAVNAARSRWRRSALWRAVTPRLATASTAPAPPSEDQAAVLAALAQLPHLQREALVLHYLADQSVDQIAVSLRVPVGTVKARLFRGRAALRPAVGGAEVALRHRRPRPVHSPGGEPCLTTSMSCVRP